MGFAALLLNLLHGPNLLQPSWLVFVVGITYVLFSWLLGGYTLLRWPWLRLRLVIQRLLITGFATLSSLILLGWMLDFDRYSFILLDRIVLLELLGLQTVFALFIRLILRIISRSLSKPVWQLMAAPHHQIDVLREWQRNPFVRPPKLLNPRKLTNSSSLDSPVLRRPFSLAVAHDIDLSDHQRNQIGTLRSQGVVVTTIEDLAQRQLERIPPRLLPEEWLDLSDLPWTNELSFQRKLKRTADVALAMPMLLISMPIFLILSFAIWLEDRGPILYVQKRTGWMGQSFDLFKLRTMRVAGANAATPWTTKGDLRVTNVGAWMRRTRLDELPQLINVLRGEMSLIGPRPEQPRLDDQLAEQIPHYRKRYWMLPGLSGWAQVCGPAYPSTIDESELKLSYDLYYLRNWNLSLDLLILAKTFKTLLKFRGV
ncbi:sugar transferase [Cyanobium sp. HWJ4-Hawea]|nr:sugar transferase [Cyanobium sp. HWJ4-Hawea]